MFDVEKIRRDFPILGIKVNGKPLVYLDSAATSQRPRKVINAVSRCYRKYNANTHSGVYTIAEEATEEYLKSKRKVAKLINASGVEEIVYTHNTTESINLVARTWGEQNIKKGDHILISELEHHSNIVPWMMLAKKNGAILDYISLNKERTKLDEASIEEQLAKGPKLVSISQCSNVLGTIVDVKKIAEKAHRAGAKIMVDGAQSAPHMKIDMQDLDCDFFAFSGHKMLAPMGIGVLYGKRDLLEEMPPFLGGGDMIRTVSHNDFTPNELPWKFEAGTPFVEGGVALGAAVDYLKKLGIENVREHEKSLTRYALEKLSATKGVEVFGPPANEIEWRGGVIGFDIIGVHPHDVATIFDQEGVAIRAGHHCAMPLVVEVLRKPALSRMSFYIYNNESDVDRAIDAIATVKNKFKISDTLKRQV